jgi:hypothetical protein
VNSNAGIANWGYNFGGYDESGSRYRQDDSFHRSLFHFSHSICCNNNISKIINTCPLEGSVFMLLNEVD